MNSSYVGTVLESRDDSSISVIRAGMIESRDGKLLYRCWLFDLNAIVILTGSQIRLQNFDSNQIRHLKIKYVCFLRN